MTLAFYKNSSTLPSKLELKLSKQHHKLDKCTTLSKLDATTDYFPATDMFSFARLKSRENFKWLLPVFNFNESISQFCHLSLKMNSGLQLCLTASPVITLIQAQIFSRLYHCNRLSACLPASVLGPRSLVSIQQSK